MGTTPSSGPPACRDPTVASARRASRLGAGPDATSSLVCGQAPAHCTSNRTGIVRGNLLELSGVLVLASVDEKPIPIFQDVTRGYPPGGDDVYPLPPVAAASRGPAS